MITLHIQLRSKVEMPFEEAKGLIACDFPTVSSTLTTGNQEQGSIQVLLDQDELSDEQRDWLRLSPFSAVYIDGYTVEKGQRQQHSRTWLPLTLVFDILAESPEEAEAYLLHKSFDIVTMLHRELGSIGLVEVQVAKGESEKES